MRLQGEERDQYGQPILGFWHVDSPVLDEDITVTELRTEVNDGTGCVRPKWALRLPDVATCHASAC
jgi:hypothetical protein